MARLYRDKEIRNILKRAAAMQEGEGESSAYGLSLEEIQQIAEESGIDPRHVATAIVELEQGDPGKRPFHLLGAPIAMHVERVIEGDLTDEQWVEMVGEINRTLRLAGHSGQVGRMREWTFHDRQEQVQVTATSRNGQTKIRIFRKSPTLAALMFALPLSIALQFAITVPMMLGLGMVTGWLMGLTIMAATLAAGRFGHSNLARRKERKLGELLNRLVEIVGDPALEALPSLAQRAADLDASELDQDEVSDKTPRAGRERLSS